MKKLFSYILGEDFDLLKSLNCIKSNQKIISLGSTLFIPCIIQGCVMFLMTNQFIKLDLTISIVISLIWFLFIFLIDRALITSNMSWVMSSLRIILVFLMGFFGATVIDLKLFESDIDNSIQEYQISEVSRQKDAISSELNIDLQYLKNEKDNKYLKYLDAQKILMEELDGSGGTNLRGYGKVSLKKEEIRDMSKNEYEQAKKEYDVLLDKLRIKHDEVESRFINNFQSNSILTRVEVFHHFVLKDVYSLSFYIMTLILLFLIECIPFGIKILGKQTSYEYLVNMKNYNTIDREKRKDEYHLDQLLKTRSFHNGNRVNESISSLQHSH